MHRPHAAASLVALIFACSGQLGESVLSFQHQLPAELQGLQSSYTCAPLEAGQHPDHRVCFFKNLLVFNGSLVYLGGDARSIPTVNTEYWLGGELQDWLTNFTSIDLLQPRPQHVVTINKAALTDWPFYHNYFHVFAEYLPSLHNVLCKYWNDCTFDPHTDLDILLLTPGIHSNHSRDAVSTDAARCMTAKPISAISTTVNNTHTAVLIKDAIAGWGPECRADHWHCLPWCASVKNSSQVLSCCTISRTSTTAKPFSMQSNLQQYSLMPWALCMPYSCTLCDTASLLSSCRQACLALPNV